MAEGAQNPHPPPNVVNPLIDDEGFDENLLEPEPEPVPVAHVAAPPPPIVVHPPPEGEAPAPGGFGFVIGGGLGAAHHALVLRDGPTGFLPYIRPKWFYFKVS